MATSTSSILEMPVSVPGASNFLGNDLFGRPVYGSPAVEEDVPAEEVVDDPNQLVMSI